MSSGDEGIVSAWINSRGPCSRTQGWQALMAVSNDRFTIDSRGTHLPWLIPRECVRKKTS
jgi:hypothetical protein